MNAVARLGLGLCARAPPTRLGLELGPAIHPLSHATITSSGPDAASRALITTKTAAVLKATRLEQGQGGLCVFTDGSRLERCGGVGGAARANTPFGTIIMKQYLGKTGEHSSFDGEILGVILGLRIIKAAAPHLTESTELTILLDSQGAIQTLLRGKSREAPLIRRFDEELLGINPWALHLDWVPGHKGVLMNELVDLDAKAAAMGESSTILIRN